MLTYRLGKTMTFTDLLNCHSTLVRRHLNVYVSRQSTARGAISKLHKQEPLLAPG